MKSYAGKFIVVLVFIFTAVLTIRTSLALVPLINPNLHIKVDLWAIKCGNIQALAEKKLTKFEENKNKHFKIYIQLTTLFSEKIDNWGKQGLDTTKLKADLAVVKKKVDKFLEDYDAYKSKLEALKKIDCNKTLSDYNNAVKDARDALKTVRKDVVDIKTYYWTQIRTDIMDLKKQIISNSGE
jgi:hypothetical protein